MGVGGFIDTEHRWIPQGFSDRALWSMAEPAIYLTTNFSEASLTVIQPHAVSPIRARANQTVCIEHAVRNLIPLTVGGPHPCFRVTTAF